LPADFTWRTEMVARGYRAAAALAAPSAAFAAETASTYGLRRTPAVVHNGRPAPKLRRPERPVDFVFTAGRLWDEGKNLAVLDRAAGQLGLPVFAAGPLSGPNGAVIDFQNIQALGPVTEREIRKRLSGRPIFASTARYEPFGLAVLEAAQAGCALVLSDIATFRELWGGAAIFVAPDDDLALAHAISGLAAHPEERERLGRAAQRQSQRYTVEAMTAGVAALYEAALQGTAALKEAAA
jgi:glycosyltransferase involved in cell wall biosynthesis